MFKRIALLVAGLVSVGALPRAGQAQTPPTLTLYSPSPVFGVGEDGAWDAGLVAVGSVVVDAEGVWHLFYNGGSTTNATATALGHATSADGITWERDPANPILTPAALNPAAPPYNLTAVSALPLADGTWALYFYQFLVAGNLQSAQLRRATAPTLSGPWQVEAAPIAFGPGGPRDWDSMIDSVQISPTTEGYQLYHSGCCGQGHNFGRATSLDGLTWTKHNDPATDQRALSSSDPVFRNSPSTWSHYINVPNVLPTDEGWLLVYQGVPSDSSQFGIGLARSSDGIAWTDDPANPYFVGELQPRSSSFERLRASVVVNGVLMVYFDPAWDNVVDGVYLATMTLTD